ncbi:MAG: hypothetical protein V2A58_15020 [Planctomycetota bacterium]
MHPIAFLLWFLMVVAAIVAWVIFLVAIWRTMKAHESVAASLKDIAENRRSSISG